MRHRFDLVVEVNTLQALEPERRGAAMSAIAELLAPRGHLLVICRHAKDDDPVPAEPPFPLTKSDLETIAGAAGLSSEGPIAPFLDDEEPPVARMRAIFSR